MREGIPEIPVTEESAFSYAYDEVGDVIITDYLGQSKNVRIPSTFEGKPVVKVDLRQCKKRITELVMPDSVKSFTLSAESKETLQYVNIPAGITEIKELFNKMYGNEIGDNCENLTSVFIPDNVTVIDNGTDGVLYGCENIKVTYKGKTYDYAHIGDLCEAINYGS